MRGFGGVRRSRLTVLIAFAALGMAICAAIPTAAGAAAQRPAAPNQTATTGSISGTVTDTNGTPIVGATVLVANYYGVLEGTATTAADGTYTVTGLAAGATRVEFTALGYVTQFWNNQPDFNHSNTINVIAGGTATANATLAFRGGLVTDANGPVVGATVTLFFVDPSGKPSLNEVGETITGPNGRYDFTNGLTPNNYYVRFDPPAGTSDAAQWYNNSPTEAGAAQFTYSGVTLPDAQLSSGTLGSISGTLTDSSSQPVSGATVRALAPDGRTTSATTAADGTYTINGLQPTTAFPDGYSVSFSAPGYVTQWWNGKYLEGDATQISIAFGQTVTGVDAVLRSNTTTGVLTGQVSDTGGFSVANATVVATNASTGEATTTQADAGGAYVLALAPGAYTVKFSAPTYVDQWWNNKPSQATADPVTITGGQTVSDINAKLAPSSPAAISGRVTNSSGQPVADATVSALCDTGLGSTTTAADGTYTIGGLIAPTGTTCYVSFSASDYITQSWNNKASLSGDPISVSAGQTTTGINAVLEWNSPPAPALSGVVEDGSGSSPTPLPDATVVVHNYFGVTVAQTPAAFDGTWSVGNLAPGVYKVEFRPPAGSKLLPQWWKNESDVAHSDGINVGPSATVDNINGVLTSGAAVSGTVTDAAGPVAGATVGIFMANSSNAPGTEVAHTTTATDGTYSVPSLQAGHYFLLFDPPTGSPDVGQWFDNSPTAGGSTEITLSSGGTTTANAQLTAGHRGSISGTVTDRSHNPIAGITVEAIATDGTSASATTTADGTYTINNLDVGIDTVWFLPPTGSTYRPSAWNAAVGKILPLTVDQGTAISGIDATLTQSGTISGVVSGPSGPIAGATVTVANYYGFAEATATTAADGSYSVTGLGPGSSRVQFTASGFVTQWWNNQPDETHSNTINVPNNGTATANATLVASG